MKKQRSLFFDTSLIYFMVIFCFIGVRILSSSVSISNTASIILNALIQIVFMFFISFLFYKFLRKRKAKEVFKDFNVKKINLKAIVYTILIGIIIYFLNIAIASFFNIFIYSTGYDPTYGMASAGGEGSYSVIQFIIDVFVTAVLPGICEEFCHRGLLLNGYKQLGSKKAIILVGVLFGLMHLNIQQFFYATIIGMFLTFLVYVTGSIIPSIIIHFINNFMGVYITFASYNKLPLGNFSEIVTNFLTKNSGIVSFLIILLVVVTMLALLYLLVKRLINATAVPYFKKIAVKAIENEERKALFEQFNLDVKEIDKENGVVSDDEIPEVEIRQAGTINGKPNIMVNFKNPPSLLSGDYFIKKPSLYDKAFLYGTMFLGIFITIATLIWGII